MTSRAIHSSIICRASISAIPIKVRSAKQGTSTTYSTSPWTTLTGQPSRSEEHTSELQSHSDLVCRLLLEKKKNTHSLLSKSLLATYCMLATPAQVTTTPTLECTTAIALNRTPALHVQTMSRINRPTLIP